MNNCNTKSNTLSVSEKLEISQSNDGLLPEVPEEIIYPNELNTFLREQLRYYVHKNGMLEKNLNELEERYSACKGNVSKLELKLSDYENLCDKSKISTSSQIVSSKILELSKRLREKTSEVESMKTKYFKLEKQAFELKSQVESEQSRYVKEQVETPPNSLTEDEIKKYSDRVSHLTNKMAEVKNSNAQLKKDLQMAKKLLQQEIGDSFENLQTAYCGWRGRAQIICDLQKKNSELKEKLKSAQEKQPHLVEVPQAPSKNDLQLTALAKENAELKGRSEDLKRKLDAAKARIKVLDIENTMVKSKLSMIKDQAVRDQEIISTLSKQINCSKEAKNEVLIQKEHAIIKLQTERKQYLQEMDEYKTVIKELREEITSLTNSKTNIDEKMEIDVKNEPLLNVFEEDLKQEEDKSTETDKKYQDLLEMIENTNKRLKMEREAHSKTQALLRFEKQKVTKAESVVARLELETNTSMKSGYSSTSNLRPLEPSLKDQLELAEESLKAVQTRLEIEQMERKADLQTFAQILKSY